MRIKEQDFIEDEDGVGVQSQVTRKLPDNILLRITVISLKSFKRFESTISIFQTHFDKSLTDDHKGWRNAKKWIKSIYAHAQAHLCHPSLGTKIKLKYRQWQYHKKNVWDPWIAHLPNFRPKRIDFRTDLYSYVSGAEAQWSQNIPQAQLEIYAMLWKQFWVESDYNDPN